MPSLVNNVTGKRARYTGASLQEVGRQLDGGHHTTVLRSINKIEAMGPTDEALNRTITQFGGRGCHADLSIVHRNAFTN